MLNRCPQIGTVEGLKGRVLKFQRRKHRCVGHLPTLTSGESAAHH